MKTIFDFLTELKKNNNRDWFNVNKEWYSRSLEEFRNLTGQLILGINKIDPFIGYPEPKDCIFRIYRDIRFSPNKDPFKPNFGAYIAKGGRKSIYAGYYIHVEPENSFLSGGIYMASPAVMKQIREDIEIYSDDFLKIVNDKGFPKTFNFFDEEKLSRVPQGFDKNSPVAEFLKFKHIAPFHALSDGELFSKDFLNDSLKIYGLLKSLNDFINRAIMGMAN